jgi:hypothetical protein
MKTPCAVLIGLALIAPLSSLDNRQSLPHKQEGLK